MSTVTKPMALDETFNTTESTPRNQADVLAGIQQAIREGFGQVAYAVEYDNTDSGLTATNVQDAIDEVDAALDVVEDDIESIEDDIESVKEVTGNPITLTDASETYAQGLSVELEPVQDLHGYDFPWVGGAGKNKCKPIESETTIKGITITPQSDGSVILNGTKTTDDGGIKITGTYATVAGQAQICSVVASNPLPTGIVDYGFVGYGATNYITPSSSYADSGIQVFINQGTTLTNVRLYPQIEMGSSRTTYAPYSNICPISGYEGVEVEDVGKNWFNSELEEGAINSDNGEPIYVASRYRTKNYISVLPSTHYIFGINGTAQAENWYEYDKDYNYIGRVGYENNFTTSAQTRYVKCYGTNELINNTTLQLEKGATATPYEPYQSRTASVTFGQTVYGGSVDVTDGGTDDEFEIVTFDGTNVTVTNSASGSYRKLFYANFETISGRDTDAISDSFENHSWNELTTTDIPFGFVVYKNSSWSNGRIGFTLGDIDTVQDANAWLQSHNVTICYKKATASSIATPKTELKLLQDTNNITTNGTTITLDYIPNNSIGDAVKASEEYTDRAVEQVESLIPQKTVLYDDAIDVGDDFSITIPSSFNYILFELSISSASYYGTGSLMVTSWDDILNILATSHESELRTCVLLLIQNRVEVSGDFMSEHGELKITAF